MKFSDEFKAMDNYLKSNCEEIKCHEIYEIKEDFYNAVKSLSGDTANLSRITELLIFRLMYHLLEMSNPVALKKVNKGDIDLFIGKRYIGRNGKYQQPDIVIEQNSKIRYLVSIKNLQSTVAQTINERSSRLVQELIKKNGVCTTAIQDIFRIENIRYDINNSFKSLTIIFSKVPKRHEKAINMINNDFPWHRFLVLEGNQNKFVDELKGKLAFKK